MPQPLLVIRETWKAQTPTCVAFIFVCITSATHRQICSQTKDWQGCSLCKDQPRTDWCVWCKHRNWGCLTQPVWSQTQGDCWGTKSKGSATRHFELAWLLEGLHWKPGKIQKKTKKRSLKTVGGSWTTESSWKGPSSPAPGPKQPQQSHPVPDHSSAQTLPELRQVWWWYHCPRQPVPGPNHSLGKEPFPDSQSKPESPGPASGHSLQSCHWSSERRDQCLLFLLPSWEFWRPQQVSLHSPPAEQIKCPQPSRPLPILSALCNSPHQPFVKDNTVHAISVPLAWEIEVRNINIKKIHSANHITI